MSNVQTIKIIAVDGSINQIDITQGGIPTADTTLGLAGGGIPTDSIISTQEDSSFTGRIGAITIESIGTINALSAGDTTITEADVSEKIITGGGIGGITPGGQVKIKIIGG